MPDQDLEDFNLDNNGIASLAGGLADGINAYLGKKQDSQLEAQKLVTAQSLMEKRQMDLEKLKHSDQTDLIKTKSALETPLDGDTAEQLYPGNGKQFVDTFTKNQGKPPTFKDGFQALAAAAGAKAKGEAADAAAETKGAAQLTKYQGMYNTDAKKEKDALDAVDTATQQIASAGKNPVAASSVPITLARMLTGTSRINVQEIQALGGSQAILDRANKIAVQMSKGTLTDDNQKWMLDLSNVLHRAHQSNMVNTGILHAKQYSQASKKPLKEAYKEIVGDEMPSDGHPVLTPGSAQPLSNEDPLGLLGSK